MALLRTVSGCGPVVSVVVRFSFILWFLVLVLILCFVTGGFRAAGSRLAPRLAGTRRCPALVPEPTLPLPPARPAPKGHFRKFRVSWNLVLVKRTWKPFLLMVSSEWNLTTMESPVE